MINIKLQQTQSSGKPFDFPVEVAVYKAGKAEPEIQKFTMNTLQTGFTIASATMPQLVVLDPRVVLLGEIEFRKGPGDLP